MRLLTIIWLFLNLLDVFISWRGIQAGATEIGFLYGGDFWVASAIKMVLAGLVAGLVIFFGRAKLLIGLNLGMFVIILWIGCVWGQQVRG